MFFKTGANGLYTFGVVFIFHGLKLSSTRTNPESLTNSVKA